jgi:hypothetical protein
MREAVSDAIMHAHWDLDAGEENPKTFKFLDWVGKYPTQILLVALDI